MRKTGLFKAKRLINGGCTSELFEVIENRFDKPVWDEFYKKIKIEYERRKDNE